MRNILYNIFSIRTKRQSYLSLTVSWNELKSGVRPAGKIEGRQLGSGAPFLRYNSFLFLILTDIIKRHQSCRGFVFLGGEEEVSGFAKFVKDTSETAAVLLALSDNI